MAYICKNIIKYALESGTLKHFGLEVLVLTVDNS